MILEASISGVTVVAKVLESAVKGCSDEYPCL